MARFSASDYARCILALLPFGRAWLKDAGSVQAQTSMALSPSFERVDSAASNLLALSLPGENADLLEEWESSLGLPDPCAGPNPTTAQRAAQVKARFVGGGGQNRARFIDYAATLGFEIEIVNYSPFRAGRSTCGNPCASNAWTFVWGIRVLANTSGLSSDVLLCELEAIKPAETTVVLLS